MRSPCRGSSWGTALPAQFVHVLPSTEGCVWPALFSWGCAKWGYSSLMSPLVSHRTNSRTFSGCSLCYNEGRTKSREVSERKHDSKELHCLLSKWNGACRFVIIFICLSKARAALSSRSHVSAPITGFSVTSVAVCVLMQHFCLHDLAGQLGHAQAPSTAAPTDGLLGIPLCFFPIVPSAQACRDAMHPAPYFEGAGGIACTLVSPGSIRTAVSCQRRAELCGASTPNSSSIAPDGLRCLWHLLG